MEDTNTPELAANNDSVIPENNDAFVSKYAFLVEDSKIKSSGFDASKYDFLFTPTPLSKFEKEEIVQSIPTILDSDPNYTLNPNMYTDQPRQDWLADAIGSLGKSFNETQMSGNFIHIMDAKNTINVASKELQSLTQELSVNSEEGTFNQELQTRVNELQNQIQEAQVSKQKAEEDYAENKQESNSYYVSPSHRLKEAIVQAKGGDSTFGEDIAYSFPTGLGSTMSLMGMNLAATFGTQIAKKAIGSILLGVAQEFMPTGVTQITGAINIASGLTAIAASIGTIGLARKWETEAEVGGFLEQVGQQQIEQWKLQNPGQEPSEEVIRDFEIEAWKQGEKLFQEQMMLAIPDAILALAMPMSKLGITISGVTKFNKGLSNIIKYNRATRTGKELSKLYFQYVGEKFEEGYQYVANERATDLTLGLNKFEDRGFMTSVLTDASDVLGSISYGPRGTLRPDGKYSQDKEFQFAEGLGGLMGAAMGGLGAGISITKDLNTYRKTVKEIKGLGIADTENKIDRFRGEVLFKAFENETLPHYLEAMRTLTKVKNEKGSPILSETQVQKETEFAKKAFDKYYQVNKYVKDIFPESRLGFKYSDEQKIKLGILKKELFLSSLNLTQHEETVSEFESLQNIDLAIEKQKSIISAIENTNDNSIFEKTYNIQERLKIANQKLKQLESKKIDTTNNLAKSKVSSIEEANQIQEVLNKVLNFEQLQENYNKLLKVKDNPSLNKWFNEKVAKAKELSQELDNEAAKTDKEAIATMLNEESNEAEIEGALEVEEALNEEEQEKELNRLISGEEEQNQLDLKRANKSSKSTPVSKKVNDLADKSIGKPLNIDNNKAVEQVRGRWNNNKANAPKDIKDINSSLKEAGLMPIHKSVGIKKEKGKTSAISLEMAMTDPQYSAEAEIIRQYFNELTPSKYSNNKGTIVSNPTGTNEEAKEPVKVKSNKVQGTTSELLDRELNNPSKRTRVWQWVHNTLKKVEQFINRPDFNPAKGSKVRYVIHRDQDSVQKLLAGDPAITVDSVAIYVEVQQGEEWIPIGEVPFKTKEQEYNESELHRFRATVWNKFKESNQDTFILEEQGDFKGRAMTRMFHLQPTEENPNTFVNIDEVTSKYNQPTKFLIWTGTFENPETQVLSGTDALTQEELDYANGMGFSQPGTVYFLLPYGDSFTNVGAYVQKLNSNDRLLTEVQDLIARLDGTKPTSEENAQSNEVVAAITDMVARPFYLAKDGIRLLEGANEDSANNVFKDHFNRPLTAEEFSSIIGEALFNIDKSKINLGDYNTKIQEEGKIKTNLNPEQPFYASSFRFTFPEISYKVEETKQNSGTEKTTTESSRLQRGIDKSKADFASATDIGGKAKAVVRFLNDATASTASVSKEDMAWYKASKAELEAEGYVFDGEIGREVSDGEVYDVVNRTESDQVPKGVRIISRIDKPKRLVNGKTTEAPSYDVIDGTGTTAAREVLAAEVKSIEDSMTPQNMKETAPKLAAANKALKDYDAANFTSPIQTEINTTTEVVTETITEEDIDNALTDEIIPITDLEVTGLFTHQTRRPETIISWITGGKVLGYDKKRNKDEDLNEFTEDFETTPFGTARHNTKAPNFQEGGLYGGNAKGMKFVITRSGKENFTPNLEFSNKKSFDASRGVGVPKPNSRNISDFTFYKVTQDGKLQKIDISKLRNKVKSNKALEERTDKDFANKNESYRVIVGDEAFNDIVESGTVKVGLNQEAKDNAKKAAETGGINLDRRGTTASPSFSKGKASMRYAGNNPNHYIVVTEDQSMRPSTMGRHGKGSTMFPTDENGKHLKELDGSKVKVYKHLGKGKYELVYANGKAVESITKTTKSSFNIFDASKDEDSNIGSDRDYLTSISGIPMKTINEAKAQEWLMKKLGIKANMVSSISELPISEQNIQDLIELRKKGLFLNGIFNDAGIFLLRNGRVGTEYHEAFHAVWKILDTKNKARILAQAATQIEGTPTDLQIEEYLADKFREYVLDKENGLEEESLPSSIKALFNRLYTLIKNFFVNPKLDIDSLFENIELGVYKGKIKFERNVTDYLRTSVDNIFDSEIEKQRRYSMLRRLVSHSISKISTTEGISEKEVLENYTLDQIHFQIYKNLMREFKISELEQKEGKITKEQFDYRATKLQNLISGIFEFENEGINKFTSAFEKDFTKYLKANYIEFKGKKFKKPLKQGVNKLFETNSKAYNIGSPLQYSNYLESAYSNGTIQGNKYIVFESEKTYTLFTDSDLQKFKEFVAELDAILDIEEASEENPTSYDEQNFEVNPESKLNNEIRRFISNISKSVYVDGKLKQEVDDLGFPLFYSPSYVYTQLIDKLANTFGSIEEMMGKLKDTNNPMLETVHTKLASDETMKRNVFKNIAAMNNVPSTVVQFTSNDLGEKVIRVFPENRRNVKEIAKNTVLANFSMLNQIKTKEQARKVRDDFAKQAVNLKKNAKETISEEEFNKIKDSLYEAGLIVPPNFYNELQVEWKKPLGFIGYQKIQIRKNIEIANLLNSYVIALDKYLESDKPLSIADEAKKLAKFLKPYYNQEIRTGYIGINGNPRFGHHKPNFMSKLISLLNSPVTSVEQRRKLVRDPLTSINSLLEEGAEYSYELFGGLNDQGNGIEYSKLTPLELELSKISLAARGKFITTIFADKGSAAIISFKNRKITEVINKLEEYRAAQKVRTKTIQDFIKNKPNDKRVPYLKTLLSKQQDTIVPNEGLISTFLQEEFETYITYLKSVGLNISGEITNKRGELEKDMILDPRIKNQFKDKNSLYEGFVNSFLMNIETFVLTSGDPIHYKNNGDIQKRNAQVYSPKDYNIDQGNYNVIYIEDVAERSDKEFLSNLPVELWDFYSGNNITDGFTWISPWRYKAIAESQNEWPSEMEDIFQKKILTNTPLSVNEITKFSPRKPHMYNLHWDSELNMMIPSQHKNSEHMLHVGISQNSETLTKIYNAMRDKKLDAAMFNSSVKVGNVFSVDEIGDEIDESNYYRFDNTFYGIQQQTGAHFLDDSVIFSSQLRSHFPTFINADKTYKIGKNETVKGSKLLEEYLDIINNKVTNASKEFFDEVSDNPKEFLKRADRDLTEVREEEIDKLPLGFPSVAAKNEMAINTNFNKQVGRQKVPGGAFVNMSAHGVSDELEIKFENGTFYIQCYLPMWTKNFFTESGEELDIQDIPKEALQMIGLRIPNEEAYSTFVLQVKDFRDTAGGIILPREATTITGFDFDIDKFFVMYKETSVNESGKITVPKSQNNRLIDIMYSVMSDEEMIPRFFNPASFQDIEDYSYQVALLLEGEDIKSYEENKAKLEALDNEKSFFNPATQAMYFQRNMAGKALIGIGANAVTSNDKMAFTNIETKRPVLFNGVEYTKLYSETSEVLLSKMRALAKMLSAYVDNGKTPVADYFNLNTDTISVFNLLLRVGVDTKTAIYFLGNPAIGNIVKHIRGGSTHQEAINLVRGEFNKTKATLIKDVTFEELEYSLKMEAKKFEIRDLRKELKENKNRNATQEKELESIEVQIEEAKAIKEKVLTNYATYYLIAQELDSVSIAHKFDAGWKSQNTYEKRIMLNKAKSVLAEEGLKYLTPVDQLFEGNLIEIFKSPVYEFVKKISPLFATSSTLFRGTLNSIVANITQRELKSDEYNSVRDFLFTHLFYDPRMFNTSERSEILSSTPIAIAEAKTRIDNDFLRLLDTPIGDNDIMRIEFNNTGLLAFSQEYIRNQFKLLESQDSKLFNNLIKYSMFTSGFKFTPFTFNHLIHPSYWEKEAVKFFESIDFNSNTSLNISNFVENLIRNTSGKMFTKKLAKSDDNNRIKKEKGKIQEIRVKLDENNYLTRDGIAPTWISVLHKGKYLPAKISSLTDEFAFYEAYTNLGDGIHTFDFTNMSPTKASIRETSDEEIRNSRIEDNNSDQPSTSVEPTIDLSREWSGDLKTRPVYTPEGINTMRTESAKPNEHFGNPFSEAGYGGTIKVSSISEAVRAYKDWLLGVDEPISDYMEYSVATTGKEMELRDTLLQDVKEDQREWILNQINQGKLDGATLLYAGKSADRGQGMHPTALAEVVEQLRTTQPSTNVEEGALLNQIGDTITQTSKLKYKTVNLNGIIEDITKTEKGYDVTLRFKSYNGSRIEKVVIENGEVIKTVYKSPLKMGEFIESEKSSYNFEFSKLTTQPSTSVEPIVENLWSEFKERILAKNPTSTIEDLQTQADKRGVEWLSNYLKKCYS